MRDVNFKIGTKIKVIDAGEGAWGCNDTIAIVTDKGYTNGCNQGYKSFNIEIVEDSRYHRGSTFNRVGEVWAVSKDGEYEVIGEGMDCKMSKKISLTHEELINLPHGTRIFFTDNYTDSVKEGFINQERKWISSKNNIDYNYWHFKSLKLREVEAWLEVTKMNKSMLKPSMVVEYANGDRRLVIETKCGLALVGEKGNGLLDKYKDDLTCTPQSLTINKVFNIKHHRSFKELLADNNLELILERNSEEKSKLKQIINDLETQLSKAKDELSKLN